MDWFVNSSCQGKLPRDLKWWGLLILSQLFSPQDPPDWPTEQAEAEPNSPGTGSLLVYDCGTAGPKSSESCVQPSEYLVISYVELSTTKT